MKNTNSEIKNMSIRLPEALLKELHYIANYECRSVNSQVLYLIRQAVAEFKEEHGETDI